MYQVLIVEDEKYVSKSIELSIPWNKLNLNHYATCNNALDALKVLSNQNIDIVITDIQMPGLSGLDLCEKIRKKSPHTQLIIISGHADFSYAKEALKYGILGYCLKPLDFEELIQCLKKATSYFEVPKNHETTVVDYLDEKDGKHLSEFLTSFGYNPNHFYVATSINFPPLVGVFKNALKLKLGAKKYAYISNTPFEVTTHDIPKNIHNIGGIGIHTPPITVSIFRKTILDCYLKSYQYFIEGKVTVCRQLDSKNYFPLLATITEALKKHDINELMLLITQIQKESSQVIYDIRFAFTLYTLCFTSQLLDNKLEDFDTSFYDFDQLTTEFSSFDKMLQSIHTNLEATTEELSSTDYRLNTNFLQIIKYLNGNFTKPISLQNIADELHLNPNYISQLFKKETQTTYIKYLTQLRINYAKKLLETTDLSVNQVCEKSGFNDYFYFLKTFKKITQISPSKYRTYLPVQ